MKEQEVKALQDKIDELQAELDRVKAGVTRGKILPGAGDEYWSFSYAGLSKVVNENTKIDRLIFEFGNWTFNSEDATYKRNRQKAWTAYSMKILELQKGKRAPKDNYWFISNLTYSGDIRFINSNYPRPLPVERAKTEEIAQAAWDSLSDQQKEDFFWSEG